MTAITPGKLYCGSCDTLREFVDGNALDAHVQAMHRGNGVCNYCGQHGDMFISGDIPETLEYWCWGEESCTFGRAFDASREGQP